LAEHDTQVYSLLSNDKVLFIITTLLQTFRLQHLISVTRATQEIGINLDFKGAKWPIGNNTALYNATNNLSEYRAVLSDSSALVSVTQEVFYSVKIGVGSAILQLKSSVYSG